MAKVELKAPIIEEIKSHFDGAEGAVLADYRGLTVAEDTELRSKLREANVIYKVYKNTYIKRAIEGTKFEEFKDSLEGPTAVAISKTDATAPARIISKFAKTAPKIEIKCGIVEGTFYDSNAIKAIAEIPGRDELLSRLLGSLKSPITNMVRVMNQIAEKKEA
ncbi:MAG: 50S ribosomal protein L10 [Lachnospiraceae bacterium]|nr:50S ribosomal protein L10 [Lachnospiraceae bacterium]